MKDTKDYDEKKNDSNDENNKNGTNNTKIDKIKKKKNIPSSFEANDKEKGFRLLGNKDYDLIYYYYY